MEASNSDPATSMSVTVTVHVIGGKSIWSHEHAEIIYHGHSITNKSCSPMYTLTAPHLELSLVK